MSKQRTNIIYTAKDIEAYFTGKLSNEEMHDIERAALDDPFLADAMEGYEIMQGKEWKKELSILHKQLEEKGYPAKVIPIQQAPARKWWKIAAVIFVIICGGALTWVLTNKNSGTGTKQEVVQQIPVVKDTLPSPVIANSTPVQTDPKFTAPVIVKNDRVNNKLPVKNYKDNKNDIASRPDLVQPVSIARVDAVTNNKDTSRAFLAPPVPPVTNNAANQSVTANKTQPLNRSFSAQVVGPDNTPLPFSNISVKSENFGTYADVKGNIRLVSSDSILIVEVKSVGYQPRTYTLRSSQGPGGSQPQNRIVMAEDEIAVKEKAVAKDNLAGKYTSRRATLIKDSVVNVEPADGWDNYNTYIANNIELPEDILKNNLHGEIGITFDVSSDGTITNIKVDQSRCNNCEELTKRLLEQGPQWKVKRGRKASAKVKVQF